MATQNSGRKSEGRAQGTSKTSGTKAGAGASITTMKNRTKNKQKVLIMLIGESGSGKTTYAKHYARVNGTYYIDVDLVSYGADGVFNYGVFLERVKVLMADNPHQCFILDGTPDTVSRRDIMDKDLKCELHWQVCFASPSVILKRQQNKSANHSIIDIENKTYQCAVLASNGLRPPVYIDTTNGEYRQYKQCNWLPYFQELCFLARYPQHYQDVELRQVSRVGHSESYKTWERVDQLVEFRGKSVIDYGCSNGYFTFKAEDADAIEMMGLDESSSAIDTARSVAVIRGSMARFVTGDVVGYAPAKHYDIALCLNLLHHVKDRTGFIESLFKTAREVVLELPLALIDEVMVVADKYNCYPTIANSHRYQRIIMHYTQSFDILPAAKNSRAHPYTTAHYRKQRIHKFIMEEILFSKALRPFTRLGGKVLRKLGLFELIFKKQLRRE